MSDQQTQTPPQRHYASHHVDPSVIARFASKVRGLKEQVKQLTTERDGLKMERDTLVGERDTLKIKADTSLMAKEVDRLKAELRGHKHRAMFDELARATGVRPEALEDAWMLSGYKAEADEPDEARLSEVVAGLKGIRGYLFTGEGAAPSGGSESPLPGSQNKPAPGSGRGGPNGPGAPVFSEELAKRDVAYVMKNYDAYVAAAKARTFQ
jgi:hypothetical protein